MKWLGIIACMVIGFGCKDDVSEKFKEIHQPSNLKESLIERQRAILKSDSLRIISYMENANWQMNSTGTGLKYEIYATTVEDSIKSGDRVFVEYTIMNLLNDTIYTSGEEDFKDMMVDFSDAESGIHELLKYMRYGERARALIPSHLAHGLAGDDNKIPPYTTLVADIHVLK